MMGKTSSASAARLSAVKFVSAVIIAAFIVALIITAFSPSVYGISYEISDTQGTTTYNSFEEMVYEAGQVGWLSCLVSAPEATADITVMVSAPIEVANSVSVGGSIGANGEYSFILKRADGYTGAFFTVAEGADLSIYSMNDGPGITLDNNNSEYPLFDGKGTVYTDLISFENTSLITESATVESYNTLLFRTETGAVYTGIQAAIDAAQTDVNIFISYYDETNQTYHMSINETVTIPAGKKLNLNADIGNWSSYLYLEAGKNLTGDMFVIEEGASLNIAQNPGTFFFDTGYSALETGYNEDSLIAFRVYGDLTTEYCVAITDIAIVVSPTGTLSDESLTCTTYYDVAAVLHTYWNIVYDGGF